MHETRLEVHPEVDEEIIVISTYIALTTQQRQKQSSLLSRKPLRFSPVGPRWAQSSIP